MIVYNEIFLQWPQQVYKVSLFLIPCNTGPNGRRVTAALPRCAKGVSSQE